MDVAPEDAPEVVPDDAPEEPVLPEPDEALPELLPDVLVLPELPDVLELLPDELVLPELTPLTVTFRVLLVTVQPL